jgi:CCR4-NOT transcription complex subunit 1
MSEEVQSNKIDRTPTLTSTSNPASVPLSSLPTSDSKSLPVHRTPRASALAFVAQAYSRLQVKTNTSQAAPQKVFEEYSTYLVDLIQDRPKSSTAPEALALLDTIQLALIVDSSLTTWNSSLVSSAAQILANHPVLQHKSGLDQALESLHLYQEIRQVAAMNPSRASGDEDLSRRISHIASRVPEESGIANVLSEVGPSCTHSSSVFRDVLSEFSQTFGPLNEPALAQLLFFFSDKHDSSNSSNGLSSALLGSLLAGRDNTYSGSEVWNLKAVAQVLSEDYGSRDWSAVAHAWDFPAFFLNDAAQFSTLMDLFRAGAKNTPPLSALTNQWRNSSGQLSVLEHMTAVPPSVFMISLNDEELADAATTSPSGPNSAPNTQCWASAEVLQRLLSLSDVPSLYRRVRDLFVKCLLSCPEVLLCSLVRLQLQVANAVSQRELGSSGLANAGLQLKTDVMRELVPLFFRPNAHHRVQNAGPALRRLYAISPSTVTAACFEAWRTTALEGPSVRLATIVHVINIARLLPAPAEAVASLLNGSKDAEFSIAVAFVMADNDYLQIKPWLGKELSSKSQALSFAVSLIAYLRKNFTSAGPRAGGTTAPLVSHENISTSLQMLRSLDPAILSQTVKSSDSTAFGNSTLGDSIKGLMDAVLSATPSLRSSLQASATSAQLPPSNGPPVADDVEEMATQYFQKIYTSEQSIGEVVEMLKRFKTSGDSKENEIFACMVHNLFDEYRFFSKYPEKELRITGILFGALIQEQLVSSITLGIALRYVLEALRKPPSPAGTTTSSGKMFNFGMFALEQFKGRLHEWPQYCSHIVQIPHLKDGYAALVSEIEREMSKNQGAASVAGQQPPVPKVPESGLAGDTLLPHPPGEAITSHRSQSAPVPSALELSSEVLNLSSPPRVAEFGPKLGRAVTDSPDSENDFDAPTDTVLDRVQFLVNNLAQSNVEQKAQDLKEMLDPKYFGWLGHFLVVKRISTQANFHSLYLSFLDNLGDYGKGLMEAIINSVYRNIGKLLRSSKITTSSSERGYLKNLGIWLGQITLARNRPILQIMLDAKELLLQGYETGKLIAVAPFLAKTLEGAKNSRIFRPPNPWLMGILGVFRSVYMVDGLKMNIKFEVEVLCKNLGIKLEEIPLRNGVLAKRIAPVKERNPDFNIKSASSGSKSSATGVVPSRSLVGSSEAQSLNLPIPSTVPSSEDKSGQDPQDTVIPNLASYVTVNASLPQLLQTQGSPVLSSLTSASLKRWVPIAVDRAIREIIQPVVERSVTIACITTKEIVSKDFAMEGDETKLRKAGQLMVANLAGSLALVTCREPLRSSVSTHLRQLLTNSLGRNEKLGEQDQNVVEQCVQICATDNLEIGCMLIEKAATEKAVRDVDESMASSINSRRNHREQTGQPFYDMSIFANRSQQYPSGLPDRIRPKPGGLRKEHLQLYDSFQRLPRQSQGPASATGATERSTTRVNGDAPPGSSDSDAISVVKPSISQQFGTEALSALTSKLDSAVSSLLTAAGPRAAEVKLAMLPQEHQIRQILAAVKQVMPNAAAPGASRPLTTSEQELILGFSQVIFKRLYELSLSEPLRLEALVALLENINEFCPKLGKDMGTWSTYAPTNTEQQRRLHRTVLLLLVRSRLLSVHDLDSFLAARADNGSNHIWLEFSLLFIRTAFMEKIATTADFPKLLDLMSQVAEGRSDASAQIPQSFRKPILLMLEEARVPALQIHAPVPASASKSVETQRLESSSSLSIVSLDTYSKASKRVAEAVASFFRNDPTTAKQQVTALLEGWIRLQSEPSLNEKALAQYMIILQRFGMGKNEEQTERFLRNSVIIVVDAALKSSTQRGDGKKHINYVFIDHFAKLLGILVRHMNAGGSADQVNAQRLGVLNKILGTIVRSMMWHYESSMEGSANPWDQRPWFRLLLNLVIDLNKPDPVFEAVRLGILSVFGAAFHVCQPMIFPAFAFSWLELVSHRHFLPNLILFSDEKGWNVAHQLLIDQLLFLEPSLRRVELTVPVKKLYEGTLRVLLVLLHDFPTFLAGFHLSFCNVIPESCVQLRNIILSATPKAMNPPDPFTPNLKIDLLPEISQSPTILSNILSPIASFRGHLDAFLKDGQRRNFLLELLPLLHRDGGAEIDVPKVNSLVVYVGAHALARLQNSQISLTRTPEMEVIQKLMELEDRGRYLCLNAIVNQLRYPSSHTHYFSCVVLYLFSEFKSVAVKEQVTRVLLERLIVNRPHPWGLLITFIELVKNQRYGFWNYPFTRCATEIEKVFESVARSCIPPGTQRSAIVGGEEHS